MLTCTHTCTCIHIHIKHYPRLLSIPISDQPTLLLLPLDSKKSQCLSRATRLFEWSRHQTGRPDVFTGGTGRPHGLFQEARSHVARHTARECRHLSRKRASTVYQHSWRVLVNIYLFIYRTKKKKKRYIKPYNIRYNTTEMT